MAKTLTATLALRDKFTKTLSKIDSSLAATVQRMEELKQKATGPAQAFNTLANKAQSAMSRLSNGIKSGMSAASNVVKSGASRIISLFGNFGNRISSALKLDSAKSAFSNTFNTFTSTAKRVMSNVVSSVQTGMAKVGMAIKASAPYFKQFGQDFKKGFVQSGQVAVGFGDKLLNVTKVAALGGAAAVVGLGKKVYDVAGGFDQQMARVNAITDEVGVSYADLRKKAIDLGAQTAFSAKEAAAGMENMASAGFNTKEIYDSMQGVLALAAVSGGDVALAAENSASALRGFGLEASQAGHVADVFAQAAAKTNAEVADIGEAMKYISPVAHSMGISLEETAAAVGILSDSGIKGSQAGTSLRGALSRLAKPTDAMRETMDALGLSFYDSNGNMKSLADQVGMLKTAFKGLTPEQQQNALVTLYGQESLSGMLALISAGPEKLRELTKSFEQSGGAADKMAQQMQNNLPSKIEQMFGALESVAIRIGDKLFPIIAPQIEKLTDWIDKTFSEVNIDKFIDNLGKYGQVLVSTFNDVKGPVSEAFGAVMDSLDKLNGKFGSAKSVDRFKQTMESVGDAIKGVAKFAENHSDAIAKIIDMLPKLVVGFAAFKIGKGVLSPLLKFGGGLASMAKASGTLVKNLAKLKKPKVPSVPSTPSAPTPSTPTVPTAPDTTAVDTAANSAQSAAGKWVQYGKALFLVGAGVALVGAGFWLMADAATNLASAGGAAIATFFGMVVAIGALLAVVAYLGPQLSAGAVGMLAFGAMTVLVAAGMWLASTAAIQLASAGGVAIAVFFGMFVAVGLLAAVFAALGPALTAGAIGMLAFGAAMVLVGLALAIATPALEVLPPVIEALGTAFATAAEGVGNAVNTILDGVSQVIDSIGNGLRNVLDGVAGVFDSIGNAALNAGKGLKAAASGLKTIAGIGAWGLAKALGALTAGLGSLTAHSGALQELGSGMQTLAAATMMLGAGVAVFSALSSAIISVGSAMQVMSGNFTTFTSQLTNLGANIMVAVPPFMVLANASTQLSATLLASMAGITIFASALTVLVGMASVAGAAVMMLASGIASIGGAIGAYTGAIMTAVAITMLLGATAQMVAALVVASFTSSMAQASAAVTSGMSQMTAAVTAGMAIALSIVTAGMAQMTAAFSAGMAAALSIVTAGSASIVSAFSGLAGQLRAAGSYAMAGLTAGLASGAGGAIAQARSIANQIASTIQGALKIHSPSRVMMEIGDFVGQGLAKGIEGTKRMVQLSSSKLADQVKPKPLGGEGPDFDPGEMGYTMTLDDRNKMQASGTQAVYVNQKQVTPQVTLNVTNNNGEPVDTDALVAKVEDAIIAAAESDLS
ncbi:phage tail tape measure protein [Enterococcus cecorum]|uniref:phage tail tape measure protein n=1 Tax=Enterococcus cecorum TaxID=44008 RepID=UPI00069B699A|nr:phage tail tape measure protein [Enterococcus cecorum]CAI3371907.1 phage tail tape measure protein [Enterococcus cecorum]